VVKELEKSDYLVKAKKRLVELKPATDGKQ
jgi:hypothetical protein